MGICILGIGDCGSTAQAEIKVQNESINKVLSDFFVKQLQDHRAAGHIIQRVTGRTGTGDVVITDVNLENMTNISLDSWQKMQNSVELKQVLSNAVDNLVDASMNATSGFLSGESEAKFEGELSNILRNEVVSKVGVEQVNNCLASVYIEQVVEGVSETGNVTLSGINMINTSNVTANCIADQINKVAQESQALNELVNKINLELEATSKGPLDFITDLFGNVTNIIILLVILAVLGIAALVFGIVVYNLFFKNKPKIK